MAWVAWAPPSVLVLCLLQGCAATAPEAAPPRRPLEPRFHETERLPYTPPPQTLSHTGGLSALVVSGGQEQARRVALTMVKALLDFDQSTLSTLFAERVIFIPDGRATSSDELIGSCLEKARALAYQPDLSPEDVVDIEAVEPQPMSERYSDPTQLPPGLHPADLAVALPTRGGHAELWRRIPCLSRLYVRPGTTPTIVGIGR